MSDLKESIDCKTASKFFAIKLNFLAKVSSCDRGESHRTTVVDSPRPHRTDVCVDFIRYCFFFICWLSAFLWPQTSTKFSVSQKRMKLMRSLTASVLPASGSLIFSSDAHVTLVIWRRTSERCLRRRSESSCSSIIVATCASTRCWRRAWNHAIVHIAQRARLKYRSLPKSRGVLKCRDCLCTPSFERALVVKRPLHHFPPWKRLPCSCTDKTFVGTTGFECLGDTHSKGHLFQK